MEDAKENKGEIDYIHPMNRRPKAGPSLSMQEQNRIEEALEIMGLEGPTKFYRQCALSFSRMIIDLHKRPQWPPSFLQSADPPLDAPEE